MGPDSDIPLNWFLYFAAASFAIGLVGVLALQIVTLVQDASTGGLDALVLSVPAAALFYGLGLLVQSRASTTTSAPTLDAERVPA